MLFDDLREGYIRCHGTAWICQGDEPESFGRHGTARRYVALMAMAQHGMEILGMLSLGPARHSKTMARHGRRNDGK